MKEIVFNLPNEMIHVDEFEHSLDKITVMVDEKNVVHRLEEAPEHLLDHRFYFQSLSHPIHSASPTAKEALEKNKGYAKFYQFSSLREFAKAIIENDWL